MTEANRTEDQYPMNPELKAQWVEALRSGKYEQGRQQLRCDNSFCCLGVLCDIVDSQAWDDEKWFFGEGEDRDSEIGVLPYLFREQVVRIPDAVETELIRMNDDKGASFVEIADYIEKNL